MTAPEHPTDDAAAPVPPDVAAVDAGSPRWAAGHVIVAVVVALLVGTLLNAQDLLETAERQPFGWQRDAAVAVASPVARFAAAVGLDRPRDAVDTALGRGDDGAPAIDDEPDSGGEPVIAAPDEQDEGAPPDATATPTDAPTEVEPSEEPTEVEPTEPAGPLGLDRGPVTASDPLRLYIGGDSMVEIQFGLALEDLADDTGMIETVAVEYDRGSGLSRPDFVDWPAKLAAASDQYDPDVMVVYFGGNDAQPLEIDGGVYDIETPEWQAEYRGRVADLMDQLVDAGHHVYWMGLPVPSSDTMVPKFSTMNTIYEEEAATRDGVSFLPAWELFTGPGGGYSEYLVDDDGDEVDMRLDDGIHLTTAGAYRLARPTIARIAEDAGIDLDAGEQATEAAAG